jgi:7,8-dihydroneopterin aldolase/epimerase/oxygenase
MLDRISLCELRLFGYHGILPEEKTDGKDFILNIDVFYDTSKAIQSDDVNHAVDLRELAEVIKNVFETERCGLLEKLADLIANKIFSHFQLAQQVKVNIVKQFPIEIQDVDKVEIEIVRTRK